MEKQRKLLEILHLALHNRDTLFDGTDIVHLVTDDDGLLILVPKNSELIPEEKSFQLQKEVVDFLVRNYRMRTQNNLSINVEINKRNPNSHINDEYYDISFTNK